MRKDGKQVKMVKRLVTKKLPAYLSKVLITERLDDMIQQADNQAVKDGQIGLGLGCLYASAKSGQGR